MRNIKPEKIIQLTIDENVGNVQRKYSIVLSRIVGLFLYKYFLETKHITSDKHYEHFINSLAHLLALLLNAGSEVLRKLDRDSLQQSARKYENVKRVNVD